MTDTIQDQPDPIATTERPTWELVIEFVEKTYQLHHAHRKPGDGVHTIGDSPEINALVLADMRERDRIGRERYSTPLQPNNGRDNLIDAYQELLDFTVYICNELVEQRANPFSVVPVEISMTANVLMQMFRAAIYNLHVMRYLIEHRKPVSPSK